MSRRFARSKTKFAVAFAAKDVDAIMKFYVPGNELFVFDLGIPRQHVGWDDYKKDWQDFRLDEGPAQVRHQRPERDDGRQACLGAIASSTHRGPARTARR